MISLVDKYYHAGFINFCDKLPYLGFNCKVTKIV